MNKTQEKICHILKRYKGTSLASRELFVRLALRGRPVADSTVRRNVGFLVRADLVRSVNVKGKNRYSWIGES